MKVEMTFNDAALEAHGYTRDIVYNALKDEFLQLGLRCTSDNDILSFEDVGSEDDFANMVGLLVDLVLMDWFLDCTSSCIFYDDGTVEDVLCSAPKIRKMLA
ncbi:MAG: hypothetical protein E7429_00935 [Ruminococcaceae bacterium]|nr:hypothetical protein [Oscillospiraceae bacterium]